MCAFVAFIIVVLLLDVVTAVDGSTSLSSSPQHQHQQHPHRSNWAVIVSTSRFWHNYRHTSNALTFYRICKRNGIPDEQILLFLADTTPCNPRNVEPGTVYNNNGHDKRLNRTNLYGCDAHVDFSGYDVDERKFLETMQGRYSTDLTSLSHRLLSDSSSNVLLYMTGHGGEGFLKFQDVDTLYTEDIGKMFDLMHTQRMYHKLLFIAETCHAESLCLSIRAPNIACVASSAVDKDSFSHHNDQALGVDVIDAFTYETLRKLVGSPCDSAVYEKTLQEFFFAQLSGARFRAPVNHPLAMTQWKMSEFFCAANRREEFPVSQQFY